MCLRVAYFPRDCPISPFWIPGHKLVFLDGKENNVLMAARHYNSMTLYYNPSGNTTDVLEQENHSEYCDFRSIYDKTFLVVHGTNLLV